MSRGTSRRARALCSALVVVFAVAQIAGAAHAATTEHARCTEHGELIDLPAPVAVAIVGSSRIAGTQPGSTSQHEHCAFAQALRHHAITSNSSHTVVCAQATACPDATAARFEAPALALYRLAPKTSPPVA